MKTSFWSVAAVVSLLFVAGPATAQGVTNLAALGEGGHLVSFSSQYNDSEWKAEHLIELSRKRADAVKRWLADKEGISEVRLATVGYGVTRPVADNGTEDGRAQNRRVELLRK